MRAVLQALGVLLAVVCLVLTVANLSANSYTSTFCGSDNTPVQARLDEVVQNYVSTKRFNGSVLVAKDDAIIFSAGYGYARRYFGRTQNTPQTKFLLGSITKTFTAAAVLHLADQHLLSLQDRVTKYLPDYQQWDAVTIHHLLNHSSGIPNYYSTPMDYLWYYIGHATPEGVISRYRETPLSFQPGSDYAYSNTNYMILASIVEKVSGQTYPEYVAANILTPLGLSDTGYAEDPDTVVGMAKGYGLGMVLEFNGFNASNLYGAGGMYSSTADLLKFLESRDDPRLLDQGSLVKTKYGHYGYGVSLENSA